MYHNKINRNTSELWFSAQCAVYPWGADSSLRVQFIAVRRDDVRIVVILASVELLAADFERLGRFIFVAVAGVVRGHSTMSKSGSTRTL